MKKLIAMYAFIQLCVCVYTYNCRADYYDLEHYQIKPDTSTISNEIRFRGDFKLYSDTYTVRFDSMTPGVIFYATGTIDVSTIRADTVVYKSTTALFTEGVEFSNWTLFDSSATFNDLAYFNHGVTFSSWTVFNASAVYNANIDATGYEISCDTLNITGSAIIMGATDKLYFSTSTWIYEEATSSLHFYVNETDRFRVTPNGAIVNGGNLYLDPTRKLYLDGGGDTYIDEYSSDALRIVSAGYSMFTFYSSYIECHQDIKPYGTSLDFGDGSNYLANMYAANYPAVSRKSLKQDIVYFDTSTITTSSFECLPKMAEYYYKANVDTNVPKNLGYVLNDDDEEDFGDLPYTYQIISDEETINQVSVNSLIGFMCELIKNLNARIEDLEAQ